MEKFRRFCKKAFSYPVLLHGTHPITADCIVITTVLFAIYTFLLSYNGYSESGYGMELFCSICLSFLYFTVFSLCLESIRPKWSKKQKALWFLPFALLSYVMGFITFDVSLMPRRFPGLIASVQDKLGIATIALYIGGIVALALILAVYFSYSHSVHQSFNRHVLNISSKVFFTSIIYGVIQLGVLFLTIIVMLLLYDDAFDYLPTLLVLINGIFYVPAVVHALTHENEDANVFMQLLVRYVMLIITLLGYAIIYVYMIKLIVTASVPSNSVYAILTALFIVSMFISYMCTSFENEGFLQKFAHNCPVIFTPFILMQCYTVIVRIGQYGLTPKRYFGIAFIIFEAAYIAYYHLYKKRTGRTAGRNILLIMCVILIISIFAPGISAKGLSTSIAKRTLSSYLKKTAENIQVTGKESMHASAAYDFLSDDEFGSGKIQKYFSGIDADTLKSLRAGAKAASDEMKDDEERDGTQYGYFSTDLPELTGYDFLDISGYSSMMHVFITDPKKNRYGDDSVCDAKTLVIHPLGNENGTPITLDGKDTIDLSSFVSEFIELSSANNAGISTEDEFRQAVKRMCITDINENARLYITSADITRNGKDEPVYITIEGFLFMK